MMAQSFKGALFGRDALAAAMTQSVRQPLRSLSWEAFARQNPPSRGGAVGSWSVTSVDPLAEILVVRDEDFADTLAWLNAFFTALSPITQWCRVLPRSQAERIVSRSTKIALDHSLGAWVGAILAECSVQGGGVQNLREVPGSAAVSTATFAAGRATAVWGAGCDLIEIARRHDDLSHGLRDGGRPLGAHTLAPLWSILAGHSLHFSNIRLADLFKSLLEEINQHPIDENTADLVARVASRAGNYLDISDLSDCGKGPQVERVRALDRLSERLISRQQSPDADAILGLGASFIDPGSSVAPELLRRHTRKLPVAPIWQGAFAGAISPFRVMTDQGGLGRLVAKSLLAPDDLEGRPSCDIAYDELVRWITPNRSLRLDLRGMSARVLSVELTLGVTCVFATGRTDNIAASNNSPVESARNTQGVKERNFDARALEAAVLELNRRVMKLENNTVELQSKMDFDEPKDARNRKRLYTSKKA